MPSLWNWLCLPRNRCVAGTTQNQKRRRRNKDNVVTLQKRKLLEDTSHFQEVPSVAVRRTTQISERTNNGVPNKRRRVQDIFNTESSDTVPSNKETPTSDVYIHSENFTHMKVPNVFCRKEKNVKSNNGHVESMYGYVPKTMQNLYTSTALEGQKMEDYFSNLHNEIYFSKFANSEATKDETGNVLQIFPFTRVPSSTSSVHDEQISLIEEDDTENQIEMEQRNDFSPWQNNISPRNDFNIEASFHSMLNSREEVLY